MQNDNANELKKQADEFIKIEQYHAAVEIYNKLINSLNEKNDFYVKCLNNRALCSLKLENFGTTIEDCKQIQMIEPANVKSYYRMGLAYMNLTKYNEALNAFAKALKLEPRDTLINKKFKECKTLRQVKNFSDAIKHDEMEPLYKQYINACEDLPSSYEGPRILNDIENNEEEFIKIMRYLKNYPDNRINSKILLTLSSRVTQLFLDQPNVVDIFLNENENSCINICGDIHGQFYDLLNIFELGGLPSSNNFYLFNGDFIDRGSFSLECATLLYWAKLTWPNYFFINRGNHETKVMSKLYGFEGEVLHKANSTVYEAFMESFDYLPLAYRIENRVFVVHGGIPLTKGVKISDINAFNRRTSTCSIKDDILWADPKEDDGLAPSKRGISNFFGPDWTQNFLELNNLALIVRSHEVKDKGYEFTHNNKLVTVFSAPNYCDQMTNKGCFLRFTAKKLREKTEVITPEIVTLHGAPHPDVKTMAYAFNQF